MQRLNPRNNSMISLGWEVPAVINLGGLAAVGPVENHSGFLRSSDWNEICFQVGEYADRALSDPAFCEMGGARLSHGGGKLSAL